MYENRYVNHHYGRLDNFQAMGYQLVNFSNFSTVGSDATANLGPPKPPKKFSLGLVVNLYARMQKCEKINSNIQLGRFLPKNTLLGICQYIICGRWVNSSVLFS